MSSKRDKIDKKLEVLLTGEMVKMDKLLKGAGMRRVKGRGDDDDDEAPRPKTKSPAKKEPVEEKSSGFSLGSASPVGAVIGEAGKILGKVVDGGFDLAKDRMKYDNEQAYENDELVVQKYEKRTRIIEAEAKARKQIEEAIKRGDLPYMTRAQKDAYVRRVLPKEDREEEVDRYALKGPRPHRYK